MAEVTVKQLAQVVNTPVEKLLEQLRDAGVVKSSESDFVSEDEKIALLSHLRKSRGTGATSTSSGKSKITLRRKRVSEIKTDASGKKTVNVEVRTKRVIRRPAEEAESAEDAAPPPAAEEPTETAVEAAETKDQAADANASAEEQQGTEQAAEQAAADQVAAQIAASVPKPSVVTDEEPVEEPIPDDAPAEESSPSRAPAPIPALAAKEAESREIERKRMSLVEEQLAKDHARIAAEQQAERQAASQRKKVAEELQRKEQEDREKQRTQEEAQRRASIEAQEVSKEKSHRKDGNKGRGKGKPDGAVGTRYGRNQLHVAKDKSGKRKGKTRRPVASSIESKHAFEKPTAPVVRDIAVPETITVAELANKMAVKAAEVIKTMMGMGVMATINQVLDQDTARGSR